MQHLDPDRLVLLALDEPSLDAGESDHLTDCPSCRDEVATLREVASLSAETQEVRELPAPPDRVWRQIAAEVTAPTAAAGQSAPAGRQGVRRAAAPTRPRRWAGWARPAFAAAAAALLAVAGTAAALQAWRATEDPEVTARAELRPLPTAPASVAGNARVLAGGADERLHVHVRGLPLSTGYYEVWLIDPDTKKMISIGTLGGEPDALLPLPATVNLNEYRLVDVSAEAYDGKTAHSGESLLRGTLTS